MMESLVIRPLQTTDLAAVARVHILAFPQSALTQLGHGLVARYYAWQLTGPHDVAAYGAFEDLRLVGFVVAGRFERALSGFVNANRRHLALRLFSRPWLLTNPLVQQRVASAGRWALRRNLPTIATAPADRKTFGVLAIAVHPDVQGNGVGRDLMAAVECSAKERGLHQLHLTVEPVNLRAVRFYERLGWHRVVDTEAWKGEMVKDLRLQETRADRTDS